MSRSLPGAVGASLAGLLAGLLWGAGSGVAAGAGTLAAPAAPAAPAGAAGVVVVGVAGLRWDDVSAAATPTIARLAARGAVGALSVKARPALTCRADGWLTLGSGARAEAYGVRRDPCDGALPPGDATLVTRNAATSDSARLGALGLALDAGGAGGSGAGGVAVDGPGAELANLPGAAPAAPDASGGSPLGGPRVRLVDAGVVTAPDTTAPDHIASLHRADDAVRGAEAALPTGADLLVVGLSEAAGEGQPHLHVAIGVGPDFPRGALRSASTRRTPYVQLIDVAPTVLRLLGHSVPAVMAGQPWQVRGAAPGRGQLVDLDRKAGAMRAATVPFFVVVIAVQVLLWLALRLRPAAVRLVALAGTAAPGASYLANVLPWWRAGEPLLALLAMVLTLSVAAALVVRRSPGAVGWLCGATLLVLVADLVTGARLQMSSVAGYSPLVAGRFAGLGNVAFGVYATAALLTAAWLAAGRDRRRAGPLVAAVGLVAVAVDGAPPWGSDVGGVLALLPAFVLLGLLVTGTRVSLLRLALAGLGAVAVVSGFALLDYARPAADRTHLGRFVGQVMDGSAGDVLTRKAGAVFGLLFHSPVTAGLPLVVAGAVLLLLRPPTALATAFGREPSLRQALVSVGAMAAIGFAVNDSGAAVVALALLLAVPATVAVVAAPSEGAGTASGRGYFGTAGR